MIMAARMMPDDEEPKRGRREEAAYKPTADEIKEGCRRIREEGFIGQNGRVHKPWKRKRLDVYVVPVTWPTASEDLFEQDILDAN
jgi:hypothetical protein